MLLDFRRNNYCACKKVHGKILADAGAGSGDALGIKAQGIILLQ
jgi:hypothetical protein